MTYAQLNEENICIGISELSGEVEGDNMILLDNYDISLLGKKYNDGSWEEIEKELPKEAEPEPTNRDIMKRIENLETVTVQKAIDAYTLELLESGVM